MITYIVKTLLCAAVLFLIYFLLLEREKMHRFNRFYLLFSIVFSLTASFITIRTPSPVVTVNELIAPSGLINNVAILNNLDMPGQPEKSTKLADGTSPVLKKNQVPFKEPIPWLQILPGLYLVVTAILLLRFIRNLSVLLLKAAYSKKVSYHEATLVLTIDNTLPNSFLKYIFIDKEKFEQGTIEKEILQHELTHVNQRHSLDIILVELIMVFAWINPLLFLFRKAIKLNHEFLADDAVLNAFNDTESYRLLLYNKVNQSNNLVLSSSFNYLITKKRLIMMTRNTSRKVAILKQIAMIPLIAAIGFLFSTRVIAQDNSKLPVNQKQVEFSESDAPQSVINEYYTIISKYKIDTLALQKSYWGPNMEEAQKKVWIGSFSLDTLYKIDRTDRDQLKQLFFQMSKKQQRRLYISFIKIPDALQKLVPTKAQIESWKNPKIYGVWTGWAKRIKNSELNKHSNTDFDHYELRVLNKDEARIMKYKIEVALLTKEQFEKTNAIALERRNLNQDNYSIRVQMWSKKALEEADAGR